MRASLIALATLLVLSANPSLAQNSRLSEGCDLAVFGGWDRDGFLVFDNELRTAIRNRDLRVLSLLVDFPLRVNTLEAGSFSVVDPASLQVRFEEVFPVEVRAAVLEQRVADLTCGWSGLDYGHGRVWVAAVGHRYAVTVVNLPRTNAPESKPPTIAFVCDTEKHRFLVEDNGEAEELVKGWTKPRSLAEEPDIVTSSLVRIEGTGLCAHRIWVFNVGDRTYELSDIGCFSSDDSPPDQARGSLSIASHDNLRKRLWCY